MEFLKKAWNERLHGLLIVLVLWVATAICVFGTLTKPEWGFMLPQVGLGLALFVISLVPVTIAVLDFKDARALHRSPLSVADASGILNTSMARNPFDEESRKRIRICVSGECEGMVFRRNGEVGELQTYFDVCNFTADSIEIDRVIGQILVANCPVGKIQHFKRLKIAPYSSGLLYVDAELSAENIRLIEVQRSSRSDSLATVGFTLTVYIQSAKGSEELYRSLTTGNYRFVNFTKTLGA